MGYVIFLTALVFCSNGALPQFASVILSRLEQPFLQNFFMFDTISKLNKIINFLNYNHNRQLLWILTRERLLWTPFVGQNHFFLCENKFFISFPSLTEKNNAGRPPFMICFCKKKFPFMMAKDGKTCFSAQKIISTSK